MTKTEAVETIHANWPPEHYSMLREALTIAVSHLEQSSNSEYVETNGTDWICEKCGQTVDGRNVTFEEIHEGCGGKCH